MRSGTFASFGPVNPSDLELFGAVPGIAAVARNEQLRVFWCNDAYAELCKLPKQQVVGTTPFDFLQPLVAEERAAAIARVMETGTSEVFYQFGADRRLLCTIAPLNVSEFGHNGVLGLVQDAPLAVYFRDNERIRTLETPSLDLLGVLTPRELELLHTIALGESTEDAANSLFRSVKTIEGHLTSIHRKLGTTSRPELVRYLVERGVSAFSREEWATLVEGASRVKKARKAAQPELAAAAG